ncbi:MAG: phage head completion/stabilization protein [Silanimonas sp.]|nr:MAG: phage head completion/stabilization protein [Silanimonas sp.]
MSAFIAHPFPPAPAEPAVINNGFFPDIEPAALRAAMRLDASVTPERLREAIVYALIDINRQLEDWQGRQLEAGYETLAEVPSSTLDGTSRLVLLYRRAVYSTVKADLTERYRDVDTTASGQRRAEDLTPSIDEQRRNARWALRDLLGRTHSTVELI